MENREDRIVGDALGRDSNTRSRVCEAFAGQLAAVVERSAFLEQQKRRLDVRLLTGAKGFISSVVGFEPKILKDQQPLGKNNLEYLQCKSL